ncbi:putative Bardet-Biedl syndrome 4 protein homolog (BBS4-like protein 4) [Leishmania infantum JPCM5]|uniref:Bardet-Biedl_syndrome_4_protein_-_putative n=2 Tax=Leishmania infantum TaxID=5671 RepID=A0A6L0XU36_LEIIN|nr:putative Bardet-Biedl syndrome 4 protein homolog (BBS4-like protein 4) [Leishmania infantum JPCM5]CAC9550270.1 Bardet-Biedl_syndrome_4_protein_-_putative [Leishmania infantum]CAM72933.1 putative Bardet-Biedl syndrome 4 protein homolog (BBS4-like protein 4) [Leishmania infantum JPCM5]SUZ46614.1 Bardet-Biedl_syndrome_4_protein_-_putative [Leishmania infantum]|eukprot:XP_001469821.1 putative Bardet-Biedl syndrome 4 protein homolog (BBS4-like protein 4) [Leishmania infantum JPCM5]
MQTIGGRVPDVAPLSEMGSSGNGLGTELGATVASPHRASSASAASTAANAQQKLVQELQAIRERRNWLIHLLYVRQEYSNCLQVIEAQLRETGGTCEYALYVKGLLKRLEGSLSESLELLQTAVIISPENAATRTQLGRALHLLGRHEEAIQAFQEAASIRVVKGLGADWEIEYYIGLCHLHRRHYRRAMDAFLQSITIQRHDCAYLQLGKAALLAHDYATALQVYEEAVTLSPTNPDLLAVLGHLYLQQGNPCAAFDYLGRCLTICPTHIDALVAASSIIQDSGDYDVALSKYRIVVAQQPDSSQVWNNIGACFIGKKMTYAAVACLRKSVFLCPLDWIGHYNLGVAFLMIGRYCSALQCLNAAVHLHADHAPAFMLLGICLGEMKDLPNACRAYEHALAMQDDFLVYLNYAVTLYKGRSVQEAYTKFRVFRSVWDQLTPEQRREQSSLIPGVIRQLEDLLEPPPEPPMSTSDPVPEESAAAALATAPNPESLP